MKNLAALILALALPLAACSADESATSESLTNASAEAGLSTPAARIVREDTQVEASIKIAQAESEPASEPASAPAPASDGSAFKEGTHYVRLTPAQPTSSGADKVEVAEAFMYSCGHCFTFEPHIARWAGARPDNVSFVRVPVNFNAIAGRHLRAYYVAQSLNLDEQMHQDFFDEIHVRKNGLQTEAALKSFFGRYGVSAQQFDETWKSFDVDTKMRRAETLGRRYKITSVPTVIINGKYKTDGRMAGSYPKLLQIIDHLVKMESAG